MIERPLMIFAVAALFPAAVWSADAPAVNTPETLRAAISDLQERFGDSYPAAGFLRRLEKPANQSGQRFEALQREALTANPLVSSQPLLFVDRDQYSYDHHNTETMFQTGEINTGKYRPGGPLTLLDATSGGTRVLHDPGPEGHVRDPEVSFDGKRVLFSMRRNREEDYHIYEIGADPSTTSTGSGQAGSGQAGSNLRQLTSAAGVFDIDPAYLPDGGIVFTSSREPKYCGCNRHIMGNLFRMEADGANIHQIGGSTLFEGHSSVTPDGRILYDRWEYVDRNFGDAQGLWTVNPDGTNHAIFWGNNTPSPGAVLDARIIPGSELCLCIFSSCHDHPWGALAIIDRSLGVDGREPVVRTWPAKAIEQVGHGNFDAFKKINPKYEDPWPLSETTFIVSRQIEPGKAKMGLYLVDTFGNELLLHAGERGCYDPMPLGPRPVPAAMPVARDYGTEPGTFYVQDASIGTHMEGVVREEIRYLRVIESPPKLGWTRSGWGGQGQQAPAMNWHNFENKRILGTVPVEEDGSAYFECPPDRFVFFQLLDEDGMMIQSMRSGTLIQSGERQGCVGCHENRVEGVAPPTAMPLALKRAPSKLTGWKGGLRLFSYQAEIQPIFDRHCVSCHDYGNPDGEKLNLAGDRTLVFNTSYTELWSLGYVSCVGGGPADVQAARSWGSHQSSLVKVLREGHPDHADVKLSADELDRIVTWVDLNAPYYPRFESAYPDKLAGRSPLDRGEVKELSKLTGKDFVTRHGKNQRAMVSFERPELSRCLDGLDEKSAAYKKAIALIRTGTERLKQKPRADMAGFQPSEVDVQRMEKYLARRKVETANRDAIREGRKVYDRDFE